MKYNIKQCGKQLLSAMSKPEIRHSMHYECGLYKSDDTRSPMASMQIDNDCALPLIRLLAIAAGLALAAMAIRSALRIRCRKQKKHCTE